MYSLIELLILSLCSARLAQLIVNDTILDPMRVRLGIWHANKVDSKPRTWVMKGLGCTSCVGWWTSLATVIVWETTWGIWRWESWLIYLVHVFAVAGLQLVWNRVLDRL